jgi:hypothetical protein
MLVITYDGGQHLKAVRTGAEYGIHLLNSMYVFA